MAYTLNYVKTRDVHFVQENPTMKKVNSNCQVKEFQLSQIKMSLQHGNIE